MPAKIGYSSSRHAQLRNRANRFVLVCFGLFWPVLPDTRPPLAGADKCNGVMVQILTDVAKRGAERAGNRGSDALFPLPGKPDRWFPTSGVFRHALVPETLFRLPNPRVRFISQADFTGCAAKFRCRRPICLAMPQTVGRSGNHSWQTIAPSCKPLAKAAARAFHERRKPPRKHRMEGLAAARRRDGNPL